MIFGANHLLLKSSAQAFDPSDLFSASEYGAWYDPSDLSTLWQNTAGTTAVTASGQGVQRIDDKSGNGLDLFIQSSTATYQESGGVHWIDFNGSAYFHSAELSSSLMVGSGACMAFAALSDNEDSFAPVVCEQNQGASSSERVVVAFDTRAIGSSPRFMNFAPDTTNRFINNDAEIDGSEKVFIFRHNGSNGFGYIDDSEIAGSNSIAGSFSDARRIEIGRQRAGPFFFDGKLYGALIVDRDISSAERSGLNEWLSDKAGI